MVALSSIPHQVVDDGYEFFAEKQLVTLFSAPNYCGECDNAGAVMEVDQTLGCSFKVHMPPVNKTDPPLVKGGHYLLYLMVYNLFLSSL